MPVEGLGGRPVDGLFVESVAEIDELGAVDQGRRRQSRARGERENPETSHMDLG